MPGEDEHVSVLSDRHKILRVIADEAISHAIRLRPLKTRSGWFQRGQGFSPRRTCARSIKIIRTGDAVWYNPTAPSLRRQPMLWTRNGSTSHYQVGYACTCAGCRLTPLHVFTGTPVSSTATLRRVNFMTTSMQYDMKAVAKEDGATVAILLLKTRLAKPSSSKTNTCR
jgi:hypothetical protein